jgi:hypothetical protein
LFHRVQNQRPLPELFPLHPKGQLHQQRQAHHAALRSSQSATAFAKSRNIKEETYTNDVWCSNAHLLQLQE